MFCELPAHRHYICKAITDPLQSIFKFETLHLHKEAQHSSSSAYVGLHEPMLFWQQDTRPLADLGIELIGYDHDAIKIEHFHVREPVEL